MMPSVENAESIPFEKIKELVAKVLTTTREVEAWRQDYDPKSDEWYTLCDLAETTESLVFALPVEMLPEKEWRYVSPAEYAACDELLTILADTEAERQA
ncbi:hypothetical protein K4B79_12315 [Streptomyces lincolnensis]|uniref:hypothetical protein n=1 Tax=Streptomyces lincolnensis TaxID=1915 RepID=UPI001E5E7C05|nr:hypothetical protein [Streptomyces lincolnensis]MCD7439009.1 hypothetical protein [Streptomyces lincolnensis]